MPLLKPIRGSRLIGNHPLARGLVGCWLFNEGSGNTVFDLSGNNRLLTFSGNWLQNGAFVDAATDRLLATTPIFSQSQGTFICCLNRQAAWSEYGAIFNVENATNNSPNEMLLYKSNNILEPIEFYPNRDQSSSDYWTYGNYSTIFPLNMDVVVAAVWRNNSILKGYLNGIEAGSLTGDASWTASAWANSEVLSIGATYGINYETNCIYKWAYAFNRALSSSEIAQLYREPFCMFEQKISPAYFFVSGAPPSVKPWWYYQEMMMRAS